jgi:hypothetical protein
MGLKEETVQGIGFESLAIFRPGIIGGNAHTPSYVAWLWRLIPGRFGTIEQDEIGRLRRRIHPQFGPTRIPLTAGAHHGLLDPPTPRRRNRKGQEKGNVPPSGIRARRKS